MKFLPELDISVFISLAAFLLSYVTFVHGRIAEGQRQKIQLRNDELEIDRLLDRAWNLLYGADGFSSSKNFSKFSEAESIVRQALVINPENAKAVRYLGYLHHDSGNKAAAEAEYRRSLHLDPQSAKALNCLGSLLEGDEAISCYERAIRHDSTLSWPHINLAKERAKKGEITKADEHFEAGIKLAPLQASHYVAYAAHLKKTGRIADAKKRLEQAVRCQPRDIDALVNLGVVIAENEDFEGGLQWIQAATKANPNDSHPYAMMAALYADRKEPTKALEFNSKATEMDTSRRLSDDVSYELEVEMKELLNRK